MPLCRPLVWLTALACWAAADTIVLKNGRRILAEKVIESERGVTYETAEGVVTLPRSIVDHVDRDGAMPPVSSGPGTGQPGTTASTRPAVRVPSLAGPAPPERVIVDGQVDRRYLEDLARQPALSPAGRETMVASFLSAVEFEIGHGRLSAALELAKRGVDAAPGDPRLLLGQAVVLIQQRELRQAREVLLRARTLAPNSAEVLKFLGFVEYSSDRVEEAIKTWKRAQTLAPNAEVQQLLERAERETAAEERFQEASSVHFTLRFEGRQITTDFREQILDTLEELYRQQERDLEVSPREPILVILYTSQAFYDVTQAPSWTGALNDGKIRVPLEGLETMTPALRSVLAHEMVHTFVRYRSRGRCPAWLNEGLAQLGEGRSSTRFAARLLDLYQKAALLPLASLNESYSGLDQRLVPAAYAQSLAVVEMLRDREGLPSLGRLLDRLAGGESVGAALRAVFGLSLAEVEEQLGAFLQRKAGS